MSCSLKLILQMCVLNALILPEGRSKLGRRSGRQHIGRSLGVFGWSSAGVGAELRPEFRRSSTGARGRSSGGSSSGARGGVGAVCPPRCFRRAAARPLQSPRSGRRPLFWLCLRAMEAERLMVLFGDDSVEVHYAGGSRLLLSPCGSEYLYEAALPAAAHSLQPAETTRQRVAFVVSAYRVCGGRCFWGRERCPSSLRRPREHPLGSAAFASLLGNGPARGSRPQQEFMFLSVKNGAGFIASPPQKV